MIDIPDNARRASTITGALILYARDAISLTVFEWERDGHQQVAWPDDGQIPPYDAAKIDLKLFNYPTGQVRVIDFPTGTRTPIHRCAHQDALFYGLTATQIEFVNNATHMAYPGDASLHPEGTFHHSETIIGGTRVEFGFAPTGTAGHDLVAFSGRSMTILDICDTVTGDDKTRAIGIENRHENGAHYTGRYFRFPEHAILEAHYPAGFSVESHINRTERICYVVSGNIDVHTGDEVGELAAGDVFRMAAQQRLALSTSTGACLLEVDGSEAPWAYTFRSAD